MLMTPEKLAANQANAKKSSGPRTDAGKTASSRNSIKHGLTGAGLALPDEDAAEVEAAFQRHFEQMKPKTEPGIAHVRKYALCSLRLERFSQAEAATLSQRVRDAGHVFDDSQFARLKEAKAKLTEEPAEQLAVLSRFKIGVEWVVEAWYSLACALSSGTVTNWKFPQYSLFEALTGHSKEFLSYAESTLWNVAAMGDDRALNDRRLANIPAEERVQYARNKLLEIYNSEVDRWAAMREEATEATAQARQSAIIAARYDGSKEGFLAKRYEAATYREMNKALKEFEIVEAAFAVPEPAAETPVPVKTSDEVGSFCLDDEPVLPADEPVAADQDWVSTSVSQTSQVPSSDIIDTASAPVIASETGGSRRN